MSSSLHLNTVPPLASTRAMKFPSNGPAYAGFHVDSSVLLFAQSAIVIPFSLT